MFKNKRAPYLFLFFFSLLLFAPIWLNIFSIKNDLLTGYFPVRFFFSESISAGHVPWWNPYVNFGIPQHADMSGGFWNPITWLISVTLGYNIYSINLETLFYVLVGGLGMYKLGDLFSWHIKVKLIAAISYMCCGYFIGNLQHLNWIAGAGYLPLCYYFYVQLLKNPSLKILIPNIFIFSLLITSSHPGILIGCMYFFAIVTGSYIVREVQSRKTIGQTILRQKLILLFLLLLVIANAALIISYVEVLPYITRDIKATINPEGPEVTSFHSLVSFILPFGTVKGDWFYSNDIALRNCYIGLVAFVFSIIGIIYDVRKKRMDFFLLTSLFFLFLSVGSLLQSHVYSWLPLINYVRLPAEFRIFSLFCLVIYGCSALNRNISTRENQSLTQKTLMVLIAFIILAVLYSVFRNYATGDSIIFRMSQIANEGSFILKLKKIVDSLSLYDTVILQGLFQILLIFFFIKAIRLISLNTLLLIAIIDVFCATLAQLPFTGYGKQPTSKIQEIVNKSPAGIPIPNLHPIAENDPGITGIDSILGKWSFYNKQPGATEQALYPITFKSEKYIYHADSMRKLKHKAFLYFVQYGTKNEPTDSGNILRILHFSPTTIKLFIKTNEPGNVVVLYKYFQHWKAYVDGKPSAVFKYNNTFIAIPVEKSGSFEIELKYAPTLIRIAFIMQILLLLIAFLVLIHYKFKSR